MDSDDEEAQKKMGDLLECIRGELVKRMDDLEKSRVVKVRSFFINVNVIKKKIIKKTPSSISFTRRSLTLQPRILQRYLIFAAAIFTNTNQTMKSYYMKMTMR